MISVPAHAQDNSWESAARRAYRELKLEVEQWAQRVVEMTSGWAGSSSSAPAPASDAYSLVDVKWGWNYPSWSSERAVRVQHLDDFTPIATTTVDRFGGDPSVSTTATGHFRTIRYNGRWVFIDPDGHPFISTGICVAKPLVSPDPADTEPYMRLFGGKPALWAASASKHFNAVGINTLGCWSDWKTFRQSANPRPYTIALDCLLMDFKAKVHWATLPVFHPDFPAYCKTVMASNVAPYKDDPYLLGVFTDNEISFSPSILDKLLAAAATDYGRKAAIKWLALRYPSAADPAHVALSAADRAAFLQYFAEAYYRTVRDALRSQAPLVLNLGSRVDDVVAAMEPVMRASAGYCDVLSINWYGVFDPDPLIIEKWADWTNSRPYIVSEFYSKGADAGFTNVGGMGLIVRTQEDRAAFYEHYTLRLLRSANCIGWHWFCYNDTSRWQAAQTFGTGNNNGHNANKGIVNYEYQPYDPLAKAMTLVNKNMYGLTRYFMAKNAALMTPPAGNWIERDRWTASKPPVAATWGVSFGDNPTTLTDSQIPLVLRAGVGRT